ncbi:hypothetical protein JB92DRAFT_1979780 [Gautieria morchelliformis]|nr:hypothetical protein JB92DRAFT_1979780 [Gautieria morchelliformis]
MVTLRNSLRGICCGWSKRSFSAVTLAPRPQRPFRHRIIFCLKADENSALAWVCQIREKTSASLRARLILLVVIGGAAIRDQLQLAEALGYTFKVKGHVVSTTIAFASRFKAVHMVLPTWSNVLRHA